MYISERNQNEHRTRKTLSVYFLYVMTNSNVNLTNDISFISVKVIALNHV